MILDVILFSPDSDSRESTKADAHSKLKTRGPLQVRERLPEGALGLQTPRPQVQVCSMHEFSWREIATEQAVRRQTAAGKRADCVGLMTSFWSQKPQPSTRSDEGVTGMTNCTMRFHGTLEAPLKCMAKYCRMLQCTGPTWGQTQRPAAAMLA